VAPAQGQDGSWDEPVNLSEESLAGLDPPEVAWFPDLAVDSSGRVHVVWCQTVRSSVEPEESGRLPERAFYTVWDGQSWSEPNDIVPPNREIVRNAITVDRGDRLHFVYAYRVRGMGSTGIYYTQADSDVAWAANAWSPPHLVSGRGRSYMGDVGIDDDGVLHLIIDDTGDLESDICPACADIFYRRSIDGGQTWSSPIDLAAMPWGASHEQMEIDPAGTLHVTWDEGWDRLTGRGQPIYSAYVASSDGGLTWSEPLTIAHPVTGTTQLAVGADGDGGVMLVWRMASVEDNAIYYQWSRNGGRTWGAPASIPAIFARTWMSPYDMYDMATDSAGHIHLVAVGRLSDERTAPLGVYHLVWDGAAWSGPETVYARDNAPEYPKLEILRGNRLHLVWFTRPDEFGEGQYHVWYTQGQSDAPYQAPPPTSVPSPTPVSSGPETDALPAPTHTPFPTLAPGTSQVPQGIDTESDELMLLALGLSPLVLILIAALLLRRRGRGRFRR
jgi:hypothetical protein